MATIKTAIQVYDAMSPGLKAMNNAMGIVINSFESLQNVSSNAVDSNSIKTARDELAKAQNAFDNVEREIKEADAAQRNFNDNIRNGQGAADGLSRKIKMMAGTLIGIAGIRKGISAIGDWLGLADVQNRAETQLATVMGQRMGTMDIQAVLDVPSLQQSVGDVGDEIQLLGAQQVATFLNSEAALHTLIPAMNNLAVQQKGANASAEDMVNIGNMMGKVMQGQVGALSRVGISFSEAEEQVLKYGTELERAAMLAQIITNNVGNMNEAIANTPQGQRMGTIDIQAVLDITSAQQSLGVLGDEIQLMGAQQVATFLNTEAALHTLIPAMNNLAVQQKGVSASAEDMVNIGNMMGKVMQGQVGALSRVGISFSEAEEQVLKYGTELERATMLAQIITNNVGNMNEAIANTPQGQIQQMRNTWGDIKETVGNHLYPAVLRFFQTLNSNLPQAESMMMGLAGALIVVIDFMTNALSVATAVSDFFVDNWSLIAPIIYGIAGALSVYYGAALMGAAATGILKAAKMLAVPVYSALTGATMANTAAQWGLNAALYACPLVWIIILIIALIAVFYAVIAAVNKFAGTSLSVTGIIFGAFTTLGAFLWNLFLGLLELVLGIINALVNPFIRIANFIGNVFTNPISSIIYLFQSMADGVLAILQKIASALDFVFGSSMADAVAGWRSGLKDMADAAVAEYAPNENYQNVIDELDLSVESLGLKRWAYGDAWDAGYTAGENLESKFDLDNILGGASDSLDVFKTGNTLDGIYNGVDDTALNTASMKDSMEGSEEELKYLRDIAEKEAVNRFTTAEIRVDMKNDMNINNEMDLDGVVAHLEEKVYETMLVAAEGVHD